MKSMKHLLLIGGLTLPLMTSVCCPANAQDPGFMFSNAATDSPLSQYRAGSGDEHGPGGVFADLDHDGFPDLVLVSGPMPDMGTAPSPIEVHLFHNVPGAHPGERIFRKITITSGGTVAGSTGVVAGDYDNDGDLDLYVLRHPTETPGIAANDELWRNQLTETSVLSFVRVSDAATDPTTEIDRQVGLSRGIWQGEVLERSLTAAWADVNRDGHLDLYVGKHDGSVVFTEPRLNAPGERDVLYLNNGDGTFIDYSIEAGTTGYETSSGETCAGGDGRLQCYSVTNAVIFADLDNDRWPDLVVTNKMNNPGIDADMLYRNLGVDSKGRWLGFDNEAYLMTDFGHSDDPSFGTHVAMGIDAGDFDNDGDLDLYVTDGDCARLNSTTQNLECKVGPANNLFVNQLAQNGNLDFLDRSNGFFGDVSADFSWGTQWLDADNDGDLDLHVATAAVAIPTGNGDIADFFYLRDGSVFVNRAAQLGVSQRKNVRGDLAADYNRDGAVDFFVVNLDDGKGKQSPSILYQNNLAAGSGGRNFLSLRLRSHPSLPPAPYKSSRDAIGARVTLSAPGLPTQIREVVAGNGNAASTASLALEFGLGSATQATVQVAWPSGRNSTHEVAANQHLILSEQGHGSGQIMGEAGKTNANHVGQTVLLSRSYNNPVVLAQPSSFNGSHVAVVRITDVQSDRFTMYVQEAPNHDGLHTPETIHWVVIEAGSWRLADGTRLEVGTVDTAATVNRGQWTTVNLPSPLTNGSLHPVLITQVQTTNASSAWVKTRQRNADNDSFQVGLEAEQSFAGFLGTETVGWLAMEPARGLWNGQPYAAGISRQAITHAFSNVDFGQDLGSSPHLIAALASSVDSDPAHLRYSNLGPSGAELKVEEDRTSDLEIVHAPEQVSFLALTGNATLRANPLAADTPPIASIARSCNQLRCTFTSTSNDDQALPAYGYTWVFGDGHAANGRSVTHTFDQPGTYRVRLTVTDSSGQTAKRFRTVTVSGPNVRLAASYVPRLGQARVTSRASNDDPAFFDYFFDPNLGKFHERLGASCNKGRPENPTFLKVWLETDQPITSCTFQASWDAAPFACDAALVSNLNAGTPMVINTDDIQMNGSTCNDEWPVVSHVGFNEVHWLRVVMQIGGQSYERRLRFRQRAQTVHIFEDPGTPVTEVHDTYVDSNQPASNFGAQSDLRIKGGTPIRFAFLRAEIPKLPDGATYASAQLQLQVANTTSDNINLHRLCGHTEWEESQLTWNNWGVLTGNSCAVFSTLNGATAGNLRLDVTSEVTPAQQFDIGIERPGIGASDLILRSSEWGLVGQRPKLVLTFQR